MAELAPSEIDAFLREPRISIFASLRPDGTPHLTPVWHYLDGQGIKLAVEESSVKARNVRNDPRVALCVSSDTSPHWYVQVNGTATVSEEGVDELVRAMSVHYMGREEGEEYAERVLRELRFAVINMTPTKILGISVEGG